MVGAGNVLSICVASIIFVIGLFFMLYGFHLWRNNKHHHDYLQAFLASLTIALSMVASLSAFVSIFANIVMPEIADNLYVVVLETVCSICGIMTFPIACLYLFRKEYLDC